MAYSNSSLTIVQDLDVENTRQLVDILFPIVFGPSVHNRKDTNDIKLEIYTGGNNLNLLIYKSDQEDPITLGIINTDVLEEVIIDLSEAIGITKWWQIRLVGLLSDFKLTSVKLNYDSRPEPQTFKMEPWVDGGPHKKRVRVWPVTVDSLGNEVSLIPYVDGVPQQAQVFTSDYPQTMLYQFESDVFGIDYAISIHACDVFELYKIHPPIGVQTLPVAKHYDQVGPEHFFRHGKIRKLFVRLVAFKNDPEDEDEVLTIPYSIIFQDDEDPYTGEFEATHGKEEVFEISIEKTNAGAILRFELGPVDFNFHRYYVTFQTAKSGADSDNAWVTVGEIQ